LAIYYTRKVSSKKISLNSIGALSPNGKSYIEFPLKTNAFTIVIFILNLLKENTNNKNEIKELISILNHENMNPFFVEDQMKIELAYNENDFTKKIETINNLEIPCESKKNKLEKLLKNFTVSPLKLLAKLRSNQKEIIKSSKLHKCFDNIAIIWDNAPTHIAIHVKELLDFLGINLVPLPVKCPDYNPIEFSWNNTKYETAKEPINDENILKNFFKNKFYESVEKNNYTDYWYELIELGRKVYYDKEYSILV
jgi:hypothetical protein